VRALWPAAGKFGASLGSAASLGMVVAGREVAGCAASLLDAETEASDAGAVPAAAGPSAGLTGGTCNCESNANYKGSAPAGVAAAMHSRDGFIRLAFGLC